MKKRAIIIGSSVLAGIVAIALTFVLFGDRSVAKALAIQQQLTNESPPPQVQRQLVQDLTRMVDKMDREQLRAMGEQIREQSRAMFEQNLDEFLAASEADRDAILDRHIEESQQWRQVYTAMRTDAFRVRGRRGGQGRNGQGRNGQGRNEQAARGDRNNGQPNGGNRPRPENRGGERRAADGRAGDGRADDGRREQYAEYWAALRVRAEERGIDLGRMGRGGRRGRNG